MWLCTAVAVIVTSVTVVIVARRGVEVGSCMGDFAAPQPSFRLWDLCVSVGETSCYMTLFNMLSIDLPRSGHFIATAVAGVRGFCPSPRQLETSMTAFVGMAVRNYRKVSPTEAANGFSGCVGGACLPCSCCLILWALCVRVLLLLLSLLKSIKVP